MKAMESAVGLGGAREKTWNRNTLGAQIGGYFAPPSKSKGKADDTVKEKTGTYFRRPRSHSGERTEQILHQISVKLFNFARDRLTEVQVMMVDERLIVSANESMGDRLVKELQTAEFKSLRQFLISKPNPMSRDKKEERINAARQVAMENVQQIGIELDPERSEEEEGEYSAFYATNTDEGDRAHLRQLFKVIQDNDKWMSGGIAGAIKWLNRDDTKNGIFWCDPGELGADGTVHAEQALVIVLARSNRKGSRAWISGTMRACTGCYLTFHYAINKLTININEPKRPGGVWDKSQAQGFAHLVMSGVDVDITAIHENWQKIYQQWVEQGQPTGPKGKGFRDEREKLQGTFAEDVGSKWQAEADKNFPLATYATELPDAYPSDDEDKLSEKAPDKQFRRMRTMSESDLERYFEIRGIKAKKGEKEKDDDQSEEEADDRSEEDDDEDEGAKSSKRKFKGGATQASTKRRRKDK
jgi:hypothetical protein